MASFGAALATAEAAGLASAEAAGLAATVAGGALAGAGGAVADPEQALNSRAAAAADAARPTFRLDHIAARSRLVVTLTVSGVSRSLQGHGQVVRRRAVRQVEAGAFAGGVVGADLQRGRGRVRRQHEGIGQAVAWLPRGHGRQRR